MKQSQFYYLLRRGLFSAGSAIIKNGLVMFNKFTTAGLNFPAQGSAGFNGTSDYIQLDTPLISGTQDFTISAWHKGDYGSSSEKAIFATFGSGNTGGVELYFSTNGLTLYIGGSLNASNPPANQWNFLVATRESGATKIFINGSLAASGTQANSITTNTNARIGSNTSNAEYLDGNLANVAIWNRALSSDEINSVMWKSYEALSGAESNGLKAWYSLDDITSPAASLANMEQLAADKDATIENKAAITAAINALS